MIKNLKAEVVNVTPAQAEAWLNEFPYRGQRTLRKLQVRRLANAMRTGRFGGNTIEIVHLNGTGHLTNGQHTLHAIVDYGNPVPLVVAYKTADTELDLNSQYTIIDGPLVRTNPDKLKALRVHETIGLSPFVIGKFFSASRAIAMGFDYSKYMSAPSIEDQANLMILWKDDITHVYELISQSGRELTKKFLRQDILSVLLAIYHYHDDKPMADRFIGGAATGAGLEEYDPRLYLRTFAATTVSYRSQKGRGGNRVAPAYDIRFVSQCWNHYTRDSYPKFIRAYERSPVIIAGTPFK